jgi:integrase
MVQAGGEPRTRSKVKTTQAGILRPLLARPLALIDADTIAAWMAAEAPARPAVAALAFRQLAAFLRWCGEHPEFGAIAQAEAHERALSAAGLPHLTIHGLRRSFGTLCEWVEVPAGVVAQSVIGQQR